MQSMIIETIITTIDPQETLNIAPMGPSFSDNFPWHDPIDHFFELRPFEPSTTLDNLQATACGVMNITDDVLLIAKAALNELATLEVPVTPTQKIHGWHLAQACRCYEFTTSSFRQEGNRWMVNCKIVNVIQQRPMHGFNRAMFAVIEAAILATRIDWLPEDEVQRQLSDLQSLVAKTGGPREKEAWAFVTQWIQSRTPQQP